MKSKLSRVLPLLLAVILLLSNTVFVQASSASYYVWPTLQKVLVNGKSVYVSIYDSSTFNTPYVRVRDIANLIKSTDKKFNVTFDSKQKRLIVSPGQSYKVVGGENKKFKNYDAYIKERKSNDITKYGKVKIVETGYYTGIQLYKDSENQKLKVYVIDNEHYVSLKALLKLLDISIAYSAKDEYLINTKLRYGETCAPLPPIQISDSSGILQSPFPNASFTNNPKTVEDCKNLLAYLILTNRMNFSFSSPITYNEARNLEALFIQAQAELYNFNRMPELFRGAVQNFRVYFSGDDIGTSINIIFDGYDGKKGTALATQNKEFFKKTQAAVQKLIDSGEITASMTQLEKATAIHKWMILNIQYKEVDGTDLDQTGYSAIVKGSAVCTGFTSLYNLMCRYVGITETSGIVGKLKNGHQWSIQILDGQKVMSDPTGYKIKPTEYVPDKIGRSAKFFKERNYTWDSKIYSDWNDAPGLW